MLEPGWRWSTDVDLISGHGLVPHTRSQYRVQASASWTARSSSPVQSLPDDAWVVGDEEVIVVNWSGATDWAKERVAPGRVLHRMGAIFMAAPALETIVAQVETPEETS